jgi:DNA-directed RNA polymerase specialized sigma24 family protein
MNDSPVEITRLLAAWGEGDKAALDALVPLVHKELRRLAHRYMRRENPAGAFQTTELVNEVYLKLVDCSRVQWQDRAHFFAISAQLMRRILVDFAVGAAPDWIRLDDALNALEAIDPRKSRVVELRFFGGLDVAETAKVLQVSPDTVHRDWRFAKTWLRRELTRRLEA